MRAGALLYLLLSILFILGCTHKDGYNVTPAGPFALYKNVLYGNDTLQQTLDAYLPVERDIVHTPVIILIHGGSWVQGDKSDFTGSGLDTFFTANGCAVVNINYRLDGKYQYPAPVDDIGLVMDYIKQKAAEWKINPDRVCLLGKSSGSQLALLYAYSRNRDNRIKAVIDGYGPTDFIDSSIAYGPLGVNVTVWLGAYPANQQSWHDASPIFYMAGSVPTVIFQGTLDALVNPVQSHMLQDSLLARGKPCMYFDWVGDGHGWDQSKWLQSRVTVLNWVKSYL